MLARSALFRLLLALLMATWAPVCLCRSHAEAAPTDDGAKLEHALHGHHHNGDRHEHHHGSPPSEDREHAPCHDHEGPGCSCPQVTVTPQKAPQTLKLTLAPLVRLIEWLAVDAFPVRLVAFYHDSNAVPRPPSTLLGMHCALIV